MQYFRGSEDKLDLLLEPHMEFENAVTVCIVVRRTRCAVMTATFWPTTLHMTLTTVIIQHINNDTNSK